MSNVWRIHTNADVNMAAGIVLQNGGSNTEYRDLHFNQGFGASSPKRPHAQVCSGRGDTKASAGG